jgi:hypothetical protein
VFVPAVRREEGEGLHVLPPRRGIQRRLGRWRRPTSDAAMSGELLLPVLTPFFFLHNNAELQFPLHT